MKTLTNNSRSLMSLLLGLIGFLISFFSIFFIEIKEMGAGLFFIFDVVPFSFWIGLILLVCSLFSMIQYLKEKRFQIIFVFCSILLLFNIRMIFPVTFTTLTGYEADSIYYINIVSSWLRGGIDFGVPNTYQHDYPLSYLIAYFFIKLGIPLDTFYRISPFVIYALNCGLLYLIINEVVSNKEKKSFIAPLSIFLFSFSSLGYWISVHYCPELLGSSMFLISLLFGIKFAKQESFSIKKAFPPFLSIFILILTHHLCIVYFIFTLFGLSLSNKFFNSPSFKNGGLPFAILGVFTYTTWFAYGQLLYPSFFNLYAYFSGFSNVAIQASQAGFFVNLTFAVYPLFIFFLFAQEFTKIVDIKKCVFKSLLHNKKIFYEKLHQIRVNQSSNLTFVFSMGFIVVFILFLIGLAAPVLFGNRILEVLLIGVYPIASQGVWRLLDGKSKKVKLLILAIFIIVVVISCYRYNSQIQRRILLA